MGELLAGDDRLPADGDVCAWVEDKHRPLQAYLNLHAGPRAGFTHRAYINVFCGSGRTQVRDTRPFFDGSPIAVWKCSRPKARVRPPRGRVPRSESSRLGTQLFSKSPRARQWVLPVVPHRNPYSTSIARTPGTAQSFTRSSDSIEPVNTPTSASVALW